MRLRHLILPVLVSLLMSEIAWAKKALDISVIPKDIQEDLIKRFPEIEKEKISLEKVDEIIRYLQLKPQIDRIEVIGDESGNGYKVRMIGTKRIGKVIFEGVKKISESDAGNIFAVKSGDVFDQQELAEQGEKLRQVYRDQGFLNAVIDIAMPPGAEGSTDVIVKVTENKLTRIHNIGLDSPNEELNKQLAKALSSKLDDPFTESGLSEINKKARAYLTKNHYIRAEMMGPNLSFNNDESEVSLGYRLDKVDKYLFDFKGVFFLRQSDIEDQLDLDHYYSSNPNVGAELTQKIRNYYVSLGYARAEVTSEESDTRAPFQKRVTFNIDEGPQIKIQNITVNGKFSRKPSHYEKFIQEHSSRTVSKGFFNKEDLDVGVNKNLILELQNEGYLQAKVISTRTQYNKDKTEVSFFVNLEEGPLTHIQSIEFSGNQAYSKEELTKATGLRPGALKLNQIESAISNLKIFYRENGYIEMLLMNEREDLITYDATNTEAVLHFKILEGPQVRVAAIVIEGNNFTKDYVILKELEFKQGDLVTPSKMDESIARLQRTGFFGTVDVKTVEEKTNVSNRTIVVKVTERDPGTFTVGAGATNERGLTLRGYTGVSYRNLFGTGRGVSLRLEGNYNISDVKYLENRVVLGYLEPYLFDTRVRGRINVTRSSTVTDYNLRQITDLNSTTYSLEKDFTSHILGIWDVWALATVKQRGLESSYPLVPTDQDIATFGPTVEIDYRDNPFNATSGTFTRLTAEYSNPVIGSSRTIEYWRSTASFTLYSKVGTLQKQPVVWANQVRGGYLENLSHEPGGGVPWDIKGFTLGGLSTIRGYEAGTEYFPNNHDLGIDPNLGQQYYLTTSSTMFLVKSEVRFPVYGNLGGAVFYDGGSVTIKDHYISEPYRASTGFGIRYNTPVGPLSLDWAWKLNMQPGEDPWRFHLSIGNF